MEAEQWGRKIRAFRKLKGYTQETLAKKLGISISVLGEVERGNRFPTDELLVNVADLLHVSVDDLTPQEEKRVNDA